jgi:uncharacterized protein YdhG (YjbR/CyaY superfamily)
VTAWEPAAPDSSGPAWHDSAGDQQTRRGYGVRDRAPRTAGNLIRIESRLRPRRFVAMAERKPAKKGTQTPAKGTTEAFTAEERAAMKARAQELKAEARANKNRADGERDLLGAIAAMKGRDRAIAKRLHALITASAPDLWPKTWYGMPAYARDGKVVCFFQAAEKFNSRYATFGFSDEANLDKGVMWPTSFALTELTAAEETKIAALVKKAVR